jgi:hypothetical protein
MRMALCAGFSSRWQRLAARTAYNFNIDVVQSEQLGFSANKRAAVA